jgi:hypothetical protein
MGSEHGFKILAILAADAERDGAGPAGEAPAVGGCRRRRTDVRPRALGRERRDWGNHVLPASASVWRAEPRCRP